MTSCTGYCYLCGRCMKTLGYNCQNMDGGHNLFLGGVVGSSRVERPVRIVIHKLIHSVSSLTNYHIICCLYTEHSHISKNAHTYVYIMYSMNYC